MSVPKWLKWVLLAIAVWFLLDVCHRFQVNNWQNEFVRFYMDNYEELYKSHYDLCKEVQNTNPAVTCPPSWAGKTPPPPPGEYP